MKTTLNSDCWFAMASALPLNDLRSFRLACRALRDSSQDVYWKSSLRDQFERAPDAEVGASLKEVFGAALAKSKAASRPYLEPAAMQRTAQWDGVEALAPAWAAQHRLAVAQVFWDRATERLASPRIVLRDAMGELKRLMEILPTGTPSPLYTQALAALQSHDNPNARGHLSHSEKAQLSQLRERLQRGQACR